MHWGVLGWSTWAGKENECSTWVLFLSQHLNKRFYIMHPILPLCICPTFLLFYWICLMIFSLWASRECSPLTLYNDPVVLLENVCEKHNRWRVNISSSSKTLSDGAVSGWSTPANVSLFLLHDELGQNRNTQPGRDCLLFSWLAG